MKVRQVAVALVEVEPVADEELVRHDEADVPHRQVGDEAPVRAVEERCDRERPRRAQLEQAAQVVQRQAGVDDVLDEQDVAVADVEGQVLEEADPRAAGVRRELDEVDRVRRADGARQIGEEDGARLQEPDEKQVRALVVARDLAAELRDARRDLRGGEKDVADARVVAQEARSRR